MTKILSPRCLAVVVTNLVARVLWVILVNIQNWGLMRTCFRSCQQNSLNDIFDIADTPQ